MGVHGLWKLIEASGKPVPLETLENKVLAVDVSIWLHQAIKGFQDTKGAPIPNAHLLGIYHRICKLLYFKIKPVFVFDGGVPGLKTQTIAKRNQLRSKNLNDVNKIQKQLLNTLLKHSAVSKVLDPTRPSSSKTAAKNADPDDLFKLPPSQLDSTIPSSDEEEYSSESSPTKHWDLHTIDEKSKEFLSLPADVRHEILTDLKETRKQSSWHRIHELPKQSDDFSDYQMKRLLKRYSVQSSLEETEKEMGGHSLSLGELESLLNDHGVITKENLGSRIASDENTRFLYIKDVKKAMEKARVENLKSIKEGDEEKLDDSCSADGKRILKKPSVGNLNIIEEGDEEKIDDSYSADEKNGLKKARVGNMKSIEGSFHRDDSCSADEKSENINSMEESDEDLKRIKEGDEESIDESCSADEKNKIEKETTFIQDRNTSDDNNLSRDLEYQKDLDLAIQLSLHSSATTSTKNDNSETFTQIDDSEAFTQIDDSETFTQINNVKNTNNEEIDEDLELAIQLSLQDNAALMKKSKPEAKQSTQSKNIFSAAKSYMMEYSGLTPSGIDQIIGSSASKEPLKPKNAIRAELKDLIDVSLHNDSSIVDAVEIMSSSSESDNDFVEVPQEVCKTNKSSLEIVIDVDKPIDEDIFSDIFTSDNKEAKPKLNFKELLKSNTEETNWSNIEANISINEDETASTIKLSESVNETPDVEKSSNSTEPSKTLIELIGKEKTKEKTLSTDDLKTMEQNLQQDARNLLSERARKERLAGSISEQMVHEAQELLQLFGVPYIIAPMEAEAQCAFLNLIELTEGTITDDSDIWLFGGKTVYKNFFNQNKTVLEYNAADIEAAFNLSRDKLIQYSLLVGSDYTVGLQGVGPVTALEIIAAFPTKTSIELRKSDYELISGLISFKKWFDKGKIAGPGKTALRTKLRNLQLSEGFPNVNVVRAYIEPEVDSSQENFTWGKPDIVSLIDYAKQKFGWTQKKSEEILKPVLKRMNDKRVQSTITDYFKSNKSNRKIGTVDLTDQMSKRVKTAVKRLGNETVEEEAPIKKKRAKKKPDADPEIEHLKEIEAFSQRKTEEIEAQVQKELKEKKRSIQNLHRKEVIPQRERHKNELMKNKMKAIEVFRKSKQGPGFVKKRAKIVRKPKDDAELSESSSD